MTRDMVLPFPLVGRVGNGDALPREIEWWFGLGESPKRANAAVAVALGGIQPTIDAQYAMESRQHPIETALHCTGLIASQKMARA